MGQQLAIIVLGMAGAATLLRRPSRALRPYALLAALLISAEVATGLYWPMFPAYAVVLLCARLDFRGVDMRHHLGPRAWIVVVACWVLCLVSLAGSYVLPMFTLPAPTGPYAVGTRTEHWVDPRTHRELAVQVWYPAVAGGAKARYMRLREAKPQFAYWHAIRTNSYQDAAMAKGRFPLLLFGPMWGGRRTQDTVVNEELASYGYVVAAVDHPGNAAREEMADGSVLRSDRAKALSNVQASGYAAIRALWARELGLWVRDDEFVLDELLAGRDAAFAGGLDATRVGAFGHSFGGASSMALLGQDARVKSALNFDGWTFDALDHRTTEPVLFVYEASGEAEPKGPSVDDQLSRADQAIVAHSVATGGGQIAYVQGTQHADFTDQTLVSPVERLTYTGPIRPARVRAITCGLALSFFDRTLKHQGKMPQYSEVKVIGSAKP